MGRPVGNRLFRAPLSKGVWVMSSAKTVVNVWLDDETTYQGKKIAIHVSAKCLDGSSLEKRAVVVLDERGRAAGVLKLASPSEGTALFQGTVDVKAPEEPGMYTWHVVVSPDETHPAADRPLHFSVTPLPTRCLTLVVRDVKTGAPLKDVSAFLYNELYKGNKPLRVEGDENGVINAGIAAGAPYEVRVECPNFNEGGCSIEAGEDPAETCVEMLSVNYNKVLLGQPGYDPF